MFLWILFLLTFCTDFASTFDRLGTLGNEKCTKTIGFCGSKRGCVFLCYDRSWDRFWTDFWSLLGSFLERLWGPNSIPKAIQNSIDFFNDFGSFWGSKLRPCWRHFWQKWGDAVGAAGFSSYLGVFVLILVRRGPILARFWTVRSRFWSDFGQIFGRCWADVGRFCGDFWLNFDPIEEAYVGRFWDDFWLKFDPIEEASSSIAILSSASCPKRAGGVARSVKNLAG